MSEEEPKGPYVYQPFGTVTHPRRARCDRLFAVCGIGGADDELVKIEGLTKPEAEAVKRALVRLHFGDCREQESKVEAERDKWREAAEELSSVGYCLFSCVQQILDGEPTSTDWANLRDAGRRFCEAKYRHDAALNDATP